MNTLGILWRRFRLFLSILWRKHEGGRIDLAPAWDIAFAFCRREIALNKKWREKRS